MTGADIGPVLAALADDHRRGVIDLLRKRARRAGDLADALGVSPAAMSRHLRVLRDAGLIEERLGFDSDARTRVYTLRAEPFSSLKSWIEDVEAFWNEQLASFKAHAEAAHAGNAGGKPKGRRRRDDVR